MNKQILLCNILYLFLSINVQAMLQLSPKSPRESQITQPVLTGQDLDKMHELRQTRIAPIAQKTTSAATAKKQTIILPTAQDLPTLNTNTNLLDDAYQEHKTNIEWVKRTAKIGTAAGVLCAILYTIQKYRSQQTLQMPTRFIATAATTGASLSWTLLQSTAGCAALGFGYYKIHSWIYDGCVKEKEFDALQTKFTNLADQYKSLKQQQDVQTAAINEHAQFVNEINDEQIKHQEHLQNLVQVTTEHATALDWTQETILKQSRRIEDHARAITRNAELQSQQTERGRAAIKTLEDFLTEQQSKVNRETLEKIMQNPTAATTTVSQEPIILPAAIKREPAAVPLAISQPTGPGPTERAATVPGKVSSSGCCPTQ